jgi:uncharacterized membrane protein
MRALKSILLYLFAIFFMLAGVNHFINPALYLKIMPPYLPWPLPLVYLSGVAEVALGAMLLAPRVRRLAAWGLIALLVAVSPANVNMALHPELYPEFSPALLWARLPLQLVLMGWAYLYARTPLREAQQAQGVVPIP